MSHLGRWLSALVDGELDAVERDRVLNHVAGCTDCRREANAMRALKRRLTALGETSAETAIATRLMDLAWTGQPGAAGDVTVAGSPGVAARAVRPAVRLAAASAGSLLAAVGMIAFALGNPGSPPAPKVTPSVDSYLLQHAYDAGQAPAGSSPAGAPAPAYRHGARLAGPALGWPQQFSPGLVTAFAASGTVTGAGTTSGAAARPAVPAGSSAGTARHSPAPMVSHHPG